MTRVFGVKNRSLDVVTGEGADSILGLPQRERDELCPLTLVAPEHPRTPVPRCLAVLGEARLPNVLGITHQAQNEGFNMCHRASRPAHEGLADRCVSCSR